jgi:hypothetical protein
MNTSTDIQDPIGINEEILKAFHLMWDPFPHGVLLLKKNRTIVDANAKAMERVDILGKKCYALSGKETGIHTGCLADTALKEGVSQRAVIKREGRIIDAYWLPVRGEEDLFVHFTIYTTDPQNT